MQTNADIYKAAKSIVDEFATQLKSVAITASFSDTASRYGDMPTVSIRFGANWFGFIVANVEHDGEIWSVSVNNQMRRGDMNADQLSEQLEAFVVVDRIVSDLNLQLS
jgi:hypothetical protein